MPTFPFHWKASFEKSLNVWLSSNWIYSKRWGDDDDDDDGGGDDDDKNDNDHNDEKDRKIRTTFEEWDASWGSDEEILKRGSPETFDPWCKWL